jgi:hypothetical protein
MTAASKTVIKSYFETGDRPTQAQFADLIDSYIDTSAAGTVGLQLLGCITSASASSIVGSPGAGGTVGAQIYQTNTTAQALNVLGGTTGTGPIVLTSAASLYQPNIVGTTTNNNAAAGSVGEYISSNVSAGVAVATPSGTDINVTSLPLTPGDWDVAGNVCFIGTRTPTAIFAWVNTSSATVPALPGNGAFHAFQVTFAVNGTQCLPTGTIRISIATSTNVFLGAESVWTGTNASAYGFLGARRVR